MLKNYYLYISTYRLKGQKIFNPLEMMTFMDEAVSYRFNKCMLIDINSTPLKLTCLFFYFPYGFHYAVYDVEYRYIHLKSS